MNNQTNDIVHINNAPDWMIDARCVDLHPEDADRLFFPDTSYNPAGRQFCSDCPVKHDCLLAGMGEEHGMFGGLAPPERQRLQRGVVA